MDNSESDGAVLFNKKTGVIDGYLSYGTKENPYIAFLPPDAIKKFYLLVDYWSFLDNKNATTVGWKRDVNELLVLEKTAMKQDFIGGVWVKKMNGTEEIVYRYFSFY